MNARFFAVHLLVDLVYLLVSPLVLLSLLVVSRCFTRPKYRRGLGQKLGGVAVRDGDRNSFWIHAVSVGEVLTAVPLIEALRERFPSWSVDVSVSTYPGFEVARKKLTGVEVFYYPLDPSAIVARAFRRRRPTVVLLIELELWPNFLLTALRKGVPVLVANGRITARSARRYACGGRVTARLFRLVTAYAAQSEAYRERFVGLGVEAEQVRALGNLKYDRQPSPRTERASELRRRLGWPEGERSVFVGGSTHPSEERILWALYLRLKSELPELQLILVPRHIERLSPAELTSWRPSGSKSTDDLVLWSRVSARLESEGDSSCERLLERDDVLVVDTVGELELFYAVADVVFVGGSLIPHGGHNLLEAARLEKPLAFGPHHANFQEEAAILLAADGARCVADADALEETLRGWLQDDDGRRRVGRNARDAAQGLGGATERHVEWVDEQLRLGGWP